LFRNPLVKVENFVGFVKRKTHVVTWMLIACALPASAAFDTEPGNTRSLALGGCLCADPDPLTGVVGNPAALSNVTRLAAEIGYTRLFNLPELAITTSSAVYPAAGGGLGVKANSFGNDLYRELQAEVAFGKPLSTLAAVGATVGYYWLTIDNYGSDGDVSLSIGIQASPISNLIWGLWGRNLIEGSIGQSNHPFPQETVTGLSYDIGGKILAQLDIAKQPRFPETYKLGIEVMLNPYIAARAGMQHQPNRAGGGFGIRWKTWRIDYGTYSHWELGWTHSVSLSWGMQ
jgi:hypothetical protein